MEELKVLAVEGGRLPSVSFKARGEKTVLVGVLMRRFRVVDLSWRLIEIDGLDATEKAIEIASDLPSPDLIMLGSVTCAGFNILNPFKLNEKLGVPVIVVVKEKPNNEAVYSALIKHFPDWKERWRVFEELAEKAPIRHVKVEEGNPVYLEAISISGEEAEKTIKAFLKWGRLPEPLRVAEIIAKGASRSLFKTLGLHG